MLWAGINLPIGAEELRAGASKMWGQCTMEVLTTLGAVLANVPDKASGGPHCYKTSQAD